MNTRKMVLSALFGALTAVGAWMSIPLQPVPFTFQILFCLLAGAMLGKKYGALSQLIYVLLGAAGLPVFAGGTGGLPVLLGPRGGYLIGFIAAAFFVGWLTEGKDRKVLANALSMLVGLCIIYLLGVSWLSVVVKISLVKAVSVGVVPFVVFDLIKLSIAAFVATGAKKALASADLLTD